ncbi:hypothetical protein HPB49_018682 [Dermacentor silvarum]|uniref:Uncharacterized protein n=1 Tax=Dermacentor silvarum TaxID=543639 RepID=A0ACB8DKL1_DERSI|nr:hypothetical protein HPB49_018682 [Dermacentor silvarum]
MEDRRSAAFEAPKPLGEPDERTDTLGTGKVIKARRMPRLPNDEIKIVVRPQVGIDIVKVGAPRVTAAIFAAASITREESAEDTVCPNSHQNIVVVSTPKRSNADHYAKMRQIHIQVVIAFNGLKVPNLVRYGATLIPCKLYRKQIEQVASATARTFPKSRQPHLPGLRPPPPRPRSAMLAQV